MGKKRKRTNSKSKSKQNNKTEMPPMNTTYSSSYSYESKERKLNAEETFFWNELCKTEAMVKYAGLSQVYEGRIDILDKMMANVTQIYDIESEAKDEKTQSIRFYKDGTGMLSQMKNSNAQQQVQKDYHILDGNSAYNHVLW